MTDTGAVCIAVAIVVAAGLIYVAAKHQNDVLSFAYETAAAAKNQSEVALNLARHVASVSNVSAGAPIGFALGEG